MSTRPNVAIVGSGPAGFYTADALLKLEPACRIDILDRLPTPYGLIRAGVAPDHAKTKNVARAFEAIARRPTVRFFGNVEVGRDVSLAELREHYDAVVIATGAAIDRRLGIPGDDLPGVVGVAAFVGWYNGHPDFAGLAPDLDTETVVVIGVGNVAVDVARVLTKTPAEMAATDIAEHAARTIHAAPIRHVRMFGRRGPLQARFTNVELREMGRLEDCAPVLDPAQLPDAVPDSIQGRERRLAEKNIGTLREFAAIEPGARRKRVHFEFFVRPVEILGVSRVAGIRMERTRVVEGRAEGTGETFDVECGLVIPAIGYESEPLDGLPFDGDRGRSRNDDGRIEPGLYAVGWIKRGPTGVIGSNKPDGDAAARQIMEDVGSGGRPGGDALLRLLGERGVQVVSFDDWKAIEAAEVAAATEGAPRRKFVTVDDMLAVLKSPVPAQQASR